MIASREYELNLWKAFDKAYWLPAGATKQMGLYSEGEGVWVFCKNGPLRDFKGILDTPMGKQSFAAFDCLLWSAAYSYEDGCGMLRRLIEYQERGKSITAVRMFMMRTGLNKGRKP